MKLWDKLNRALFAVLFAAVALIGGPAAALIGDTYTTTVLLANAVTYTVTATPYNLASISLPFGKFVCYGQVIDTAAGTTFPSAIAAFNTVSATLPTAPAGGYTQYAVSAGATVGGGVTGPAIVNSVGPTVEYLVIQAAFTGAAPTAYGAINCVQIQ